MRGCLALCSELSTYAAILTHDNTPYGVWRNQVTSDLAPLLKAPGGTLEELSDRVNALSLDVRASFKIVFDLSPVSD